MSAAIFISVINYLLGTLGIGAWAGTRIKDTSDFAVAGYRLPLIMMFTKTASRRGSAETVMGIPEKCVNGALCEVVEDRFGASMCLVLAVFLRNAFPYICGGNV